MLDTTALVDEAAPSESTVRVGVSALVAGLLASELTAGLALPWADSAGLAVAILLLLPVAATISILFEMGGRIGARLPRARKASIARLSVVASLGVVVLSLGAGLSNLVLIDSALKPRMLATYALSGLVAAAAAAWAWRSLPRRRSLRALDAAPPRALLLGVALTNAAVFAAYDALFLTYGYWRFHVLLLALTLGCSCAASLLWLDPRRLRRWAIFGGAMALLAALPSLRSGSLAASFDAMLRTPTSHQRILLLARQLTDRDHDGFSAHLGGGDCDDSDKRAYPLSTQGRDCLGWVNRDERVSPRPPVTLGPVKGPKTILLVTIDAFRCGFGQSEVPELLDACPQMTQLGKEGALRLHSYTTYPGTAKALRAMHTLDPATEGRKAVLLGSWFSSMGYETRAVAVPMWEFGGPTTESFETLDGTLDKPPNPSACLAESVTDRVLSAIRSRKADAAPLFLWAHYFDPHAPYVDQPGSMLATAAPLARYASEVRRTDAAIGRLTTGLRQLATADDIFILVSADHGEGLGEKGNFYHGAAVNEAAVRVPILTWSPNVSWTHAAQRELPANIAEIGPFLAAVAKNDAFTSSGETFFKAHVRGGYIVGFYRDGWKLTHHQAFGWTELYNVLEDPFELHDLSNEEPHKLDELKRRLAAHLVAADIAPASAEAGSD